MRVLLDTHALLWWLADERRLSLVQRETVERSTRSGERLGLSAISFWEIAKLLERGRLRLPRSADQLFEELESHPELDIYPLTPRISLESTRLGPCFHADPADQIIAATARVHGLRLVTADERIRRSGVVAFV
jgi:PIN domain nuclease of toxin-antitoxin system